MQNFNINPNQFVRTLSQALELAVDGINNHQLRTAVISKGIADKLGMKTQDQSILLFSALLHDIGAAPNLGVRKALADHRLTEAMGDGVFNHAEAGYLLMDNSLCFHELAEPIRHHHDSWSGRDHHGMSKTDIPLASRIICLADRVETMLDSSTSTLLQRENILEYVNKKRGTRFDPEIVDAFVSCVDQETFLLDLMNSRHYGQIFAELPFPGQTEFSVADVRSIAELYAVLIDRMSEFTATHSRSVSGVAVLLAEALGFSRSEQDIMGIAGLLHDLGKLSIPNEILEKNGPLSVEERTIIKQHTYYTYRILEQIDNFGTIAEWAAFHHETLDGMGYPFRIEGDAISLGSRIMAVADIFVALAENRPYRKRLERGQVKAIMDDMVGKTKIDGRVVTALFDIYDKADAVVLAAENRICAVPQLIAA